ncbi:MaoC family dehydratase [[Mycobacterium] wendilense]|uniref:MaoC family dehydratase n=1 Tax=[Mycobacterium] wendilense TaxID=3064284 RepID=A0ABN9P365_9MYCO|nr:MaoC family dehydratase [Mycolicibacterium sp. MU0050]CAJ1586004.1 MaoC family dehydratase [Mycolicibacterium sp. MU0050]
MTTPTPVGGPYFDELHHGMKFDDAPSVTLTNGLAAVHQAVVGDRLRLPLDAHLSHRITGHDKPVAHPGLVADLAIGQSTLATHHVKANLFYRGLRFLRYPHIGDTLATVTEVVGLRENSPKPGRAPTGLAALRMTTRDQEGRPILDFYRCAMLPLSDAPDPNRTRHTDDLTTIGPSKPAPPVIPPWDLRALRDSTPGTVFSTDLVGQIFTSSGDVVSSAPELARLTLNIAATHHDSRVGAAGRLVYGGHTIGIALAQASRALPNLATVLAWDSCDHTGPVHEGDTLISRLSVLAADPLAEGGALRLRSVVSAIDAEGNSHEVLDWLFWALLP